MFKVIFSSVPTSLTNSRPYLFLKMPISESQAGNLIRAINKNNKDAIRCAVNPNPVFNKVTNLPYRIIYDDHLR